MSLLEKEFCLHFTRYIKSIAKLFKVLLPGPTQVAEEEDIQREAIKYTPSHATRKGHFADCAGRDASAGRIVCSLKPKKATKILCSALYQLAIL